MSKNATPFKDCLLYKKIKNVIIENLGTKKQAKEIKYIKDNEEKTIFLTGNDLVFITNGCCADTSCYGDQNTAPDLFNIKNDMQDDSKMIVDKVSNLVMGTIKHACLAMK